MKSFNKFMKRSFDIIASLIGIVTQIFIQIFIGLLAFMIEETKGVWLIIQKQKRFISRIHHAFFRKVCMTFRTFPTCQN